MSEDKAKMAAETINDFLGQFGQPDSYTNLVLGVFFEELYLLNSKEIVQNESIPVSGESQQERSQDGRSSGNKKGSEHRHPQPGPIESANQLEKKDRKDNP